MTKTNRQVVIEKVNSDGYTADALETALFEAGLDGDATYSLDNMEAVRKATISVLETMTNVKSETEGGYSKTYNIESRIAALKSPMVKVEPSIRARNLW